MKFALFFMAEYIKMVAVSMIGATLFFGGYLGPDISLIPGIGAALKPIAPLMGPIYLFIKTAIWMFLIIWLRATLPRIRYDRLMALGWKIMFPLALANVVVTAIVIVLVGG
jgi:NADH-quinone oxidoreductase subunit H